MVESHFKPIPQFTQRQIELYHAKFTKEHPDKCWIWKGTILPNGYGRIGFKIAGKTSQFTGHRLAYFFKYGEIPHGLCVLHKCDTPSCVNPSHLFLGTHQENRADCVRKGRQAKGRQTGAYTHPERLPRGDKNGSRLHPERRARGKSHGRYTHPERTARGERGGLSKLTDRKVQEMRIIAAQGISYTKIAERFGVTRPTAARAVKGETWSHVP